jgi:predicted transcriptional regulator
MTQPAEKQRLISHEWTPTAADLIAQMRDMRDTRDVSQRELDDILGVADGLVAKFENHLRSPALFTLLCWAQALNARVMVVPDECDVVLVPRNPLSDPAG